MEPGPKKTLIAIAILATMALFFGYKAWAIGTELIVILFLEFDRFNAERLSRKRGQKKPRHRN